MTVDTTHWSYQSVERRPVTVELFGPIVLPAEDPSADHEFELMGIPAGSIIADSYIDVKTKVTIENAGTCTADLATNEDTPTVVHDDLDMETAAKTYQATGVLAEIDEACKLQLAVTGDGTEAATVAGEVWVYVVVLRRDAL